MTSTVGILQPGYLPWLGFFEQVARSDVFVLYDDVQFEKGSWRNRNRVKTAAGATWLTVPVLTRGRGPLSIREIEINPTARWAEKHVRTLAHAYATAPCYAAYAETVAAILRQPWKRLVDLDLELIRWLVATLGIDTPLVLSSELGVPGSNVQRLVDIVRAVGGDHFYEGAAGRDYIDPARFEEAGIEVTFQDYAHPTYPQQHGEFVSHLSVVDLLFNCGDESLGILATGGVA